MGETAPTGAGAVRYRLRQSFRYDYDAPVTGLRHRLVVVPPSVHGDQRLRLGAVTVREPKADVVWRADAFGNRVATVVARGALRAVELRVDVVVERSGAEHLAPVGTARDPRLHEHRRLTALSPALRRLAREVRGADPLVAADALCDAVRDRVAYVPGATTVRTTAAEALVQGSGVCQDQAHVMLAAGRAAGLACRYVSGHLVGQGGTHAWVEVVVPDGAGERVVGFDPCHARRTDDRYVTVAVGRDYADVPPTSGSYLGRARGTLTGTRELLRQDLLRAAA